jgi:glycosyltransferase involved in cell wall biosynthesis
MAKRILKVQLMHTTGSTDCIGRKREPSAHDPAQLNRRTIMPARPIAQNAQSRRLSEPTFEPVRLRKAVGRMPSFPLFARARLLSERPSDVTSEADHVTDEHPVDGGSILGRVEPKLSVVIATRDRPELLDRCLKALAASLGPGDEILVCDSASRDPRVKDVSDRNAARWVRLEQAGTSRARNAGWRDATNEVVAFIDDDVFVAEGWARAARRAMRDFTDVAFVTGRVTVPPWQPDVTHPVAVDDYAEIDEIAPGDPRPRGGSGNLVIRRGALMRVGGFDEALGPGARFRSAEDKDLFDRLLLCAVRGRFDPEVLAFHEQWRSRTDRLRVDWAYAIGGGARVAKLLRLDRRQARRVAKEVFLRWGLFGLLHAIRQRYKTGVAAASLRLIGASWGFVIGLTARVVDGHFRTTRTAATTAAGRGRVG